MLSSLNLQDNSNGPKYGLIVFKKSHIILCVKYTTFMYKVRKLAKYMFFGEILYNEQIDNISNGSKTWKLVKHWQTAYSHFVLIKNKD